MDQNKTQRRIRSYVLRQGRLTSGQAYALEHGWSQYGIDFSHACLDLDHVFGRIAPRVLDIGVGMGTSSITMAAAHPENDYLAVEVHQPGVGSLIRQASIVSLTNVRVICHDVLEVLEFQIPDNSIERVYVFFPDPWPKKRHHKRRLINPGFLTQLLPKLVAHGRIFIATDWQELAAHVLQVCDTYDGLVNLAGPGNPAPRPVWRPLTKFEQRGRNLQHAVWDFVYGLA